MNQTKWIFDESGKWVQDGIISGEQQAKILSRYQTVRSGNPLLLFFAIIGSLLIGAGIILIFATNWWRMPVIAKLITAFLPLLAAQSLCLYVAMKRYGSAAFREGSAVFLCLSFFAVVALIGQTFHTSSDLASYLLLCGLFTLPAAYLFRSKAALSIYAGCALYSAQDWKIALLLFALSIPLYYLEIRKSEHRGTSGFLLILLSVLLIRLVFTILYDDLFFVSGYDIALSIGAILLLVDVLFRRISPIYFLTPPKLLGCLCISLTIWIAGIDFSGHGEYGLPVIFVILLLCAYGTIRYRMTRSLEISDVFAACAILLSVSAAFIGAAANLLMLLMGIFFIVSGGKTLQISSLNIGMAFLVLLIGTRFFDSSLSLLVRGIVFILLGAAFLAVNIIISRKRRGLEP